MPTNKPFADPFDLDDLVKMCICEVSNQREPLIRDDIAQEQVNYLLESILHRTRRVSVIISAILNTYVFLASYS